MNKISIFIFLTFLLFACKSTNDNKIDLFNEISFNIVKDEKVVNNNSQKDYYLSFFENSPIQVPLFKSILSDNYAIYIGIPVNLSVKELYEYKISQVEKAWDTETDSTSYYYLKYFNNENYIVEYCKIVNNSSIYILANSKEEIIVDSLFSKSNLSARIDN